MNEEIAAIESGIAAVLGVESRRLPALPHPEHAWDDRRKQYNSVEVMRWLIAAGGSDDSKVVGIANVDLFIPMLTFVFGQAQLGGRFAVVSLARLHQEFYGLPADHSVLIGRALKEVAHELGHTFGLAHCPDRACAMTLSTDIRGVDRKTAEYCTSCRSLSGLSARQIVS